MNGTRYNGASKGDTPKTNIEIVEILKYIYQSDDTYTINMSGLDYLEGMKQRKVIENYEIVGEFVNCSMMRINISEDLNINITITKHESKFYTSCMMLKGDIAINTNHSINTYEDLEDYIVKFKHSNDI
jgi:hypothetical protein